MSHAEKSRRWALRRITTAELFRTAHDAEQHERAHSLDRVVIDHLDLADALARRYGKSGAQHDLDDLRQVACLGLIKASRRYEPAKGVDFVSFAVPTISGEIKRYLRDSGWVVRPPRGVQELWARSNAVSPLLAQTLGRTPSLAELSTALGESESDVDQALAAYNSLHPLSLDAPAGEDAADTLGDTLGYTDERFEHVDVFATVAPAMRLLPERERRILHLRFFEEMTQQQIASELGITQMHVSRLLTKTLQRLRLALSDLQGGAHAVVSAAVPDDRAEVSAA